MDGYGIWGTLLLALDLWAIISVLMSNGTTVGKKVLWIALILLLPLVGFIIWALAGPRSRATATT